MRRTYIIIGTIFTLIALGIVAYFLFRNTDGLEVSNDPNVTLPTSDNAFVPDQTGAIDPDAPLDITQPAVGATPRLAQISKGPVALGSIITPIPTSDTSSSTELVVRYIERQSGNVFHYNIRNGSITRTSNRTVPGIMTASWLPDASVAYVRYLSGADFGTINTYALSANGAEGFFLPQNFSDIVASSTGVLGVATGVNGSVASLTLPDGSNTTNVFTTPLTAIRASFAGAGQYLAFTKPSASLSGAAFLVNSAGQFSRVAGPSNGLVALASPSGKWVLVSSVLNNSMQLRLINTETLESIALPLGTIVDKCVWGADERAVYCGVPISPPNNYAYPDDWYQGAAHFSDRVWKIDVIGRFAQLVVDFKKETSQDLDAVALSIDEGGTALTFVNKNDRSLWVYKL